jgi:hypothetical protein
MHRHKKQIAYQPGLHCFPCAQCLRQCKVNNVFTDTACTCQRRQKKNHRGIVGQDHRGNQTYRVPVSKGNCWCRLPRKSDWSWTLVGADVWGITCNLVCQFPIWFLIYGVQFELYYQFPIQFHICQSPIRIVLPVSYSVSYLSVSNLSCMINFLIRLKICYYWNPYVQNLLRKSDSLFFMIFSD